MPPMLERFLPVLLLIGSNVFMTFAWYGHLRYKSSPLMLAILASWGIALFEYCLMVPANRLGSMMYSAPQLKGMQEVITLLVFAGFSSWYLEQPLKWNHWAGFGLIVVAAWLIFLE
ncbi:DMT family protein [Lysobacter olei]